jgi:hypothetical protein
MDGTTSTFSANNNVTAHDVILFFATSLDTTATHSLVLTAEDGGDGQTGLVLDRVVIYGTTGNVGFMYAQPCASLQNRL